jgi:hypothetical protein
MIIDKEKEKDENYFLPKVQDRLIVTDANFIEQVSM